METHGGKIWDALFLLIKDDDEDFILNIINRMPCEFCVRHTNNCIKDNNINFKGNKEDIFKSLWTLRCLLHPHKYINNDVELKKYLNYLLVPKEQL